MDARRAYTRARRKKNPDVAGVIALKNVLSIKRRELRNLITLAKKGTWKALLDTIDEDP